MVTNENVQTEFKRNARVKLWKQRSLRIYILVEVSGFDSISGLDAALMEALAVEEFNSSESRPKPSEQIALFLPFSRIPMDTTGPFSNITVVIQQRASYSGENDTTVLDYGAAEYGNFHKNPVSGVGILQIN